MEAQMLRFNRQEFQRDLITIKNCKGIHAHNEQADRKYQKKKIQIIK